MKRTFHIEVEIDDNGFNNSRVTTSDHYHRVFLTPNSHGSPMYAVFAHELGHVIGHEFCLPKAMRDPRLNLSMEANLTPAANLVASEIEAWDLAEIALRVRDARAYALASYENNGTYSIPTFYPYTK